MPIILGGGISGLSAAYYLLKKSNSSHIPKVLEASNRFGGWIKTDYPTNDKIIRFEYGPRTIRPKGERGFNTLELCSDIGLKNDLLPITFNHPAAKNRLLAVNNELYLLPSSITSIFKTTPPFSKPLISALWHDITHKYNGEQLNDDSMYNFIERRFGNEIAKYLISSMICGICAGDAKEISVKFLMKELFEMEQQYSNVSTGIYKKLLNKFSNRNTNEAVSNQCDLVKQSISEKWSIYSMNEGLEMLPKTLLKYLSTHGVDLQTNSKCQQIEFHSNCVKIYSNNESYETDYLVSSLPSYELGKILKEQHPMLADELLAIPYVDVAVVNLHFDSDALLKTTGFGFLVPPSENLSILGVLFDSCCFDMKNNTVLTVMMGGKWFKERLGNASESDIYNNAIKQIRSILKIEQTPVSFKVNILRKCIPQYVVGHYERINRIFKYIDDKKIPLKLCGTAYDGVGVNDAIYSAKVMANSIH